MKQRITTMACILGVWLLLGTGAWAGDGQIDIAEIPYTISSSGSYIVVHDLATIQTDVNGITIDAENVTLDLNGHAIIGPGRAAGTTGNGIYVPSPAKYNIAIRNGTVRDWRLDGIDAYNARNSQFEALRCYNNGDDGMRAGIGSTVSGNSCRSNGNRGIYTGIGTTVSGNSCAYNGGPGIFAGPGNTVTGNTCRSNGFDGIYTVSGCTISGNTCTNNTGDGIQVSGDCRVVDNTCDGNGYLTGDGAGILATGSDNRITNNHCTDNDRGLDLDGADNIVSGNTLIGNTTPLDAVAGNQLDILISELPYTISQPGMYRLTGNLTLATQDTNGITIDADNVTLDLNGHAIIGPGKAAGTSGHGIDVYGTQYNIAIRNGTLRDWRLDGVYAINARNSQFEAMRCYNNGDDGLVAGPGSTVTGNTCYNNGDDGINASVGSTVSGNACYDNGDGIQTSSGCTVSGNTCRANDNDGINAASGSTVSGNTCTYNTGDGIQVSSDCRVVENTCDNNGYSTGDGAGINALSSDNCIEHNLVTDNDRGIDCNPVTGNYIASNRASGNTTQYDIAGGNTLGAGDLANVAF